MNCDSESGRISRAFTCTRYGFNPKAHEERLHPDSEGVAGASDMTRPDLSFVSRTFLKPDSLRRRREPLRGTELNIRAIQF
jgi:hypothetical protein